MHYNFNFCLDPDENNEKWIILGCVLAVVLIVVLVIIIKMVFLPWWSSRTQNVQNAVEDNQDNNMDELTFSHEKTACV